MERCNNWPWQKLHRITFQCIRQDPLPHFHARIQPSKHRCHDPNRHSKMAKPPSKKSLRSKRGMMIAPGLLHSYHQARRLFTKNGVKPQVAASSAIASAATNEPTVASSSMITPTCTPMTVASVAPQPGVHYKMCQASLNQDAPLLQLPDDVLVRCHYSFLYIS